MSRRSTGLVLLVIDEGGYRATERATIIDLLSQRVETAPSCFVS